MGSALRKMKREQKLNPEFKKQLNFQLTEAAIFNRGFQAGAKEQRESDIECLVSLLEGLEDWQGIGGITAKKIRDHSMSKFGK
jgi:hypothetical protein